MLKFILLSLLLTIGFYSNSYSADFEVPFKPFTHGDTSDKGAPNRDNTIKIGYYAKTSVSPEWYRDGWGMNNDFCAAAVIDHFAAIGFCAGYSVFLPEKWALRSRSFQEAFFGDTANRPRWLYTGIYSGYHLFYGSRFGIKAGCSGAFAVISKYLSMRKSSFFYIIMPDIALTCRLKDYLSAAVGVSYRHSWECALNGINDRSFRGFSIKIECYGGLW